MERLEWWTVCTERFERWTERWTVYTERFERWTERWTVCMERFSGVVVHFRVCRFGPLKEESNYFFREKGQLGSGNWWYILYELKNCKQTRKILVAESKSLCLPPSWGRQCFCTFCLSVSLSVTNLVLTSPTRRLIAETWNFVQWFIRTGGSNNFSWNYSGSKRGGCEISCAHFSEVANHRDLKLCSMLHYH
jgi:hypothetical protein